MLVLVFLLCVKNIAKVRLVTFLFCFLLVSWSILSLNRVVELLRQDITPLVRKQKKKSR